MEKIAISADGVEIHYEVHGENQPALVFVHGWCCDRSYWQKQLSYFAPQYTVVLIDLAGHGASGANRQAWTIPAFGQDVVSVIEQLGLRQSVLIGHSMGGPVIVETARQMPDRVIGLIGVDTIRNPERNRSKEEVAARVAPFQRDFVQSTRNFVMEDMFVPTSDSTWAAGIAEAMASAPPEVGTRALEGLFSHDNELRVGLRSLQVPVVLINAAYQPTNLEATVRYGMQVELMEGVGHFVMIEDAENFNRLAAQAAQQMVERAAQSAD
jgi:pimeloyl-ACP methyl ester carboxylesterase